MQKYSQRPTSENAVIALEGAIRTFGAPATILSDNGSCFVGQRGRKKHGAVPMQSGNKGVGVPNSWKPTLFEASLLDRGIELINSRPYNPQTNGKLERFFRTVEEHIRYYGSMSDFIEYYNERKLHWSLDIANYERPRSRHSLHEQPQKRSEKKTRNGWRGT